MHGVITNSLTAAFATPGLTGGPSTSGITSKRNDLKLPLSAPLGANTKTPVAFIPNTLRNARTVPLRPSRLQPLLASRNNGDKDTPTENSSIEFTGEQQPDTRDINAADEHTDTDTDTEKTSPTENDDIHKPKKENALSNFNNPLPGVEIGIPLNILASFFSQLRYGENVLGIDDAILQACLGYLTYGTDRLLDAYTETGEISDQKRELYDNIKKNTLPMISAIAAGTAHAFNTLNQQPETRPFIPLLATTFAYKQLKENFGSVKPFYIATMWTAACVILPAVMHDHDFSILASPQDYLPAALLMFGSTNLADAKDIAEDMEKGIETLPATLGRPLSDTISYAALATAALMIGSQLFGQ